MPLRVEVELGPGDIVLDGDPAPPPTERGTASPTFRPMSVVAKQSPSSETAKLLYSYSFLERTGYETVNCNFEESI